jgi:hypothetical protein
MATGPEASVTHVQFSHEVAALADDILDPSRKHAVVCVTSPTWSSEPLVDAEALAEALGAKARVYVMATGRPSWDLTARLPPRFDVYGGATRIWWPDLDVDADPFRHPLLFVHARAESPDVVDQIVRKFEDEKLLEVAVPASGAELGAVVTAVRPHLVDLELSTGERAYASLRDLPLHGLEPEAVLDVGQAVRVQVLPDVRDGRARVTLVPFGPDPWARFEELHPVGTVVEGRVVELQHFGAFVLLFPGVKGLLHKSKITSDWVDDPRDVLEVGDIAPVRVVSFDRTAHKAELSLLGVKEGEAVPPGSLFPGGPPWMTAPEPLAEEPEPEPVPAEPTAAAAPAKPTAAAAPGSIGVEDESGLVLDREPGVGELAAVPEDSEELERLIEEGGELERRVGELFESTERRMQELRAEAAQLRRVLEDDLVQARARILRLAEDETGVLTGSTEDALANARREAEELRTQLEAVEEDRRAALEELGRERSRGERAQALAERRKKELQRERALNADLSREVATLDPAERFLRAVRSAWERNTLGDDRRRFPWRAPALGSGFLASLDEMHGIARERIVDVCAHVASGRARDIPGLELHPLRSADAGGSPQLRRADGAKAYRCSLQANTPAARRLHYWQLSDGDVELAKVVYHDDFSI